MELWLVKNNNKTNILPLISNLTWTENIDALGVQLDFSLIHSDSAYIPILNIELGDHVILIDDTVNIFTGIIVTESKSGRQPIGYIAMDYAFYLNKNEDIYQFNCKSDVAIKKVLSDYSIKHNIIPMRTVIKQIYLDKTVSSIIQDILNRSTQQTGIQYNLEMSGDTLSIQSFEKLLIDGAYTLISNPTKTRSIQDLKNSIKIYTGNEDYNKIITRVKDDNLINKYGLLQQVESVEDRNIAQARNIAKKLLDVLSKIPEDNGCTVLGNIKLKAGRIITIQEEVTGLQGKYIIKSCTHNYGSQYTVDLGLKRWTDE